MIKDLWTLVESDGTPATVGKAYFLRGEEELFHLVGGDYPHKPSSSGRIYVTDEEGNSRSFFPHVLQLTWVYVPPFPREEKDTKKS